VHSGTAPFSPGAYSCGMQLVSLKAVIATVWVSAVLIAGLLGNLNSLSSWAVLAGVALLPPIVMMWRWNAPRQTMSESIQEARR
jgi:cyanate permease